MGLKLIVIHFWKEHSVLSVDCRNNRHSVRISKNKLSAVYHNLVDNNIKLVETKFGAKLEAQRYIYTKPVRKLHATFIAENEYVSLSSFYRLKPFYVLPPTEREKESCMCLNAHCLYEPLKKNVPYNNLSESLSSYLLSEIHCEPDEKNNFSFLECLTEKCSNNCKIKGDEFSDYDTKLYSYYTCERVAMQYYNKKGCKVIYYRTAREDKEDTLANISVKLQKLCKRYITHRYFIASDKVFWSNFKMNYNYPILTMDYSENINLTAKHEAQIAHFSGRQYTLHCTVLEGDSVSYLTTSQMIQDMIVS